MRQLRTGHVVALMISMFGAACRSAPSAAAGAATAPASAPGTTRPSVSSDTARASRPTPQPPQRAHLEPQQLPRPSLAPLPLAAFRESVDSMVNDPQFSNAHWGILIVDPERGDTLYSHNADKLFMPASNQKIVTGAVGLTQLGPDYQWRTLVELRGEQKGATFSGTIVLHGTGDPSWSDAMQNGDARSAFAPIVDALRARGITRIVGGVASEGNAFSDAPYGFGWAFDDFDYGYSAPVDELNFNEGFFTLTVKAGSKVGQFVSVSSQPTMYYPRAIVRAVARTRSDSVGEGRDISAVWDSTASALLVTGTLPLGDSVRIELAYRHPDDAAIAAVEEYLTGHGIEIVSPPSQAARPTATDRRGNTETNPDIGTVVDAVSQNPAVIRQQDTLLVLVSPPLRDVLKRMQKPSQNQIAEILFKTVALERTGFGRADSARAVVQRQLVDWGIAPDAIAVRDGSGLSRHDYVAPRTLVKILDTMRRGPNFDVYYPALPIAGVDGTIASRMKGTAAANNVHAKTGTVDKARSLSGYITTADGQMLVFSFLCNNFTVPTRAVERVQDAIAVRLASMRIREQP